MKFQVTRGPPPPGARQNLPDQRGKETQIFGEEGETGGNAETLYNTLLKLKEKRGCITTKVAVCLLCVCVNYWVMSNSLRPRGLSMGFFRQEYWSGELVPPPGDFPGPWDRTRHSRIAGRFFAIWATQIIYYLKKVLWVPVKFWIRLGREGGEDFLPFTSYTRDFCIFHFHNNSKNTFLVKFFFGFSMAQETKKILRRNVFLKLLWKWKIKKISGIWSKIMLFPAGLHIVSAHCYHRVGAHGCRGRCRSLGDCPLLITETDAHGRHAKIQTQSKTRPFVTCLW